MHPHFQIWWGKLELCYNHNNGEHNCNVKLVKKSSLNVFFQLHCLPGLLMSNVHFQCAGFLLSMIIVQYWEHAGIIKLTMQKGWQEPCRLICLNPCIQHEDILTVHNQTILHHGHRLSFRKRGALCIVPRITL